MKILAVNSKVTVLNVYLHSLHYAEASWTLIVEYVAGDNLQKTVTISYTHSKSQHSASLSRIQ